MYSFWYNAPTLLPTGATVEMELNLIQLLYRLKYPDLFGCCYKGIFVNFTPVRAQ